MKDAEVGSPEMRSIKDAKADLVISRPRVS